MIEFDGLIAIADRVLIGERLQGQRAAFKFQALLPLTNSAVGCSPWIGIPPPPRGALFP
jgi:hypothetical protein